MVAKITSPSSVSKALNYNEKKVQKGVATCLYAGNFLKDASTLSFGEKLHRFKALHALNTRAKTNTLHISLNFDPSESLSQERLVQIASSYLSKIGFSEQPYLVYEHRDAGHPHIHIVTTNIQENGRRINTYNIGKNQSQKARKEIEEAFGLVKASGKKTAQKGADDITATQKIRYGKTDTKRAITNVLHYVLHSYHYTSHAELNAVLKLYNLAADAGADGSRIHRNRGLLYRILDERGYPIGVPIKASSIFFKPTLPYLEVQFKKGEGAREPFKQGLKTAIDFQLYQRPINLAEFVHRLQGEKVTVTLRKNTQEVVYGLTYIDHRTKAVFNGSDLGKSYSAAGIQKRILEETQKSEYKGADLLQKTSPASLPLTGKDLGKQSTEKLATEQEKSNTESRSSDLLHQLLKTEKEMENVPYEFRKKKRPGGGLQL
ncbi:relaxase/mobilization nuclease domain-containing protein [Flavisolibacter sp. BT320]|nr:relaxase/mobilization nuclease domain-containing protein [Flavisolibacter longurius]